MVQNCETISLICGEILQINNIGKISACAPPILNCKVRIRVSSGKPNGVGGGGN